MRFLIPIIVILSATGCSTWILKERCSSTNWFEYSQEVAFKGKYLEEDGFIKDCKGVDRISSQQIDIGFKLGREKMCQYDEIYARGREGVPVFFNFCGGLDMARMKSQFDSGLKEFCTKSNGYTYGKSGKIYLKVCSAKKEEDFLPSYKIGRKEYLLALIKSLKAKNEDLRVDLATISASESRLSNEYSSLPHPQECSYETVYNSSTQTNHSVNVCREASYIVSQRFQLRSELSRIRGLINDIQTQISKSIEESAAAQKELDSLT